MYRIFSGKIKLHRVTASPVLVMHPRDLSGVQSSTPTEIAANSIIFFVSDILLNITTYPGGVVIVASSVCVTRRNSPRHLTILSNKSSVFF